MDHTEASDAVNGLRIVACADWSSLCARVASYVDSLTADPFVQPVLIVGTQAQRRSLRQWMAASGPSPSGICAGIEMLGLPAFRARLEGDVLGLDPDTDPWRSAVLGAHVVAVMQDSAAEGWFRLVQRHLDGHAEPTDPRPRPGRLLATAGGWAGLLRDYLRYCPQLLLNWDAGADVDALGRPLAPEDLWQAQLWRRLVARLEPSPHPARRGRELCVRLAGARIGGPLPEHLGVVAAEPLPPTDLDLLHALGGRIPVRLWQLGRPAPGQRRCALARRYGRVRDASWQECSARGLLGPSGEELSHPDDSTLLGALQRDVLLDREPHGTRIPDGSIQVHLCHGPDRQVEVLREILCELFDTDPGLQPRDVVVACTDLERYAPLLSARLGAVEGSGLHPGHRLRARLTTATTETNPVLDLIVRLLLLPDSRATSAELLALCALPAVARRFGLDEEALGTLPELFTRAQLRWGVDSAQRARLGLRGIRQGTWVAAIDRLLAGLVVADSPLTRLDTVVPVEHLDPSQAQTIGALAELVSRVRMHLLDFARPAPVRTWAERLRETLTDLVDLPPEDSWQLNQVSGLLGELAQGCPQDTPLLERTDIAVLVSHGLPTRHRRAVFGSGDLTICGLGELHGLDHQVVCLLGVDDAHLPPRIRTHGDDLLARPGVLSSRPDRPALARQQLLDAVLAARQRLIVVGCGADPLTGQLLPEPVVLADLLEATGVPAAERDWPHAAMPHAGSGRSTDLVRWHSLQPHAPINFLPDERSLPGSFDIRALAGARSLAGAEPPARTAPPWQVVAREEPTGQDSAGDCTLDELAGFFQDPAVRWFRNTFGFIPADPRQELPADLPLELDGLAEYTIGTAMLESLLAGEQAEAISDGALLSGALPPGPMGLEAVGRILPQARGIALEIARLRAESQEFDFTIPSPAGVLTGQIVGHGDALVEYRFARTRAKDLVGAWVRLLCAVAAGLPIRRAVLVDRQEIHRLQAPAAGLATTMVPQLLAIRRYGSSRFTPLPPRTALRYVQLWEEHSTRIRWLTAQEFDRETRYSLLWREYLGLDWSTLSGIPPENGDPGADTSSRFTNLSRWLYRPLSRALDSSPRAGDEQ